MEHKIESSAEFTNGNVSHDLKPTIGDSIPPTELKIAGYALIPPQRLNIGLEVWINFWSAYVIGEVIAVHEYPNEVFKFDLKVTDANGKEQRIYNVSFEMLSVTKPH